MLGRLLWKPLPQRGPLHRVVPMKTGGVRVMERKGEKEGEGGAKKREKIRRTTATRAEPNAETNVPGETPLNGAYGANKVETNQGLGLASLNINFYRQT